MNLSEAIASINGVIPKAAGHLIKHDNWNDLVNGVLTIADELGNTNTEVDLLKGAVSTLTTDLQNAQNQIDELIELKEKVAPLLNQYIVKTRCDRLRYALGEQCTITAEVTDLRGDPVAGRPWIDFVSSWGSLKPAGGFESRGGEGDNSISVRTDSAGIARVILRSSNNNNFSSSEELQIENIMATTVGASGMSFAQTILDEPAPAGSFTQAAFQMMSVEYEKPGANLFKTFADNYQFQTPIKPTFPILPMPPLPGWQDYRATVMAFAKPDGDPTTPDNTRGGSTIQITFRDWLFNWIGDYVFNAGDLELEITTELAPIWELTEPFELLDNVQSYLGNATSNIGIIGQHRFYNAQEKALDNITIPSGDPFKNSLKTQVKDAVVNQARMGILGESDNPPFIMAMLNNGKQSSQVKSNVDGLDAAVQQQASVKDAVVVLEGRMQASETMGGRIETSLSKIVDDVQSINVLDETSIQAGVQKLNTEFALIRANFNP